MWDISWSAWFIQLPTYFYHTAWVTTDLSFHHTHTHTHTHIYIYIYIYIYMVCKRIVWRYSLKQAIVHLFAQLRCFKYSYLTLIILHDINHLFALKWFQVFLSNTGNPFFVLIICLYTVKCFQVLLFNTTISIQY